MAMQLSQERTTTLKVDAGDGRATAVLKALASTPRLRILEHLEGGLCNVSEVAASLGMPVSTATMHIQVLEKAGLLTSEHQPAVRGSQKVCARTYDQILVQLPQHHTEAQEAVELSMPVGAYVDCMVAPTCGLAAEDGIIGLFDDPSSFYEPGRLEAQLLWFHEGYVEYRFPNRLPPGATLESLQLSMEICSEAPLNHGDWPSDITVWINAVEIGSWTSPADFGGQRGKLTPAWWESRNSQYGLLKVWQVNGQGSLVDGLRVSPVSLARLNVSESGYISVRVGVKADARHKGGLNLFGRGFGNYPQDIVLRLRYK